MKKILILLSSFTVLISLILVFALSKKQSKTYPSPTNDTMIRSDMEEKEQRGARERWFDEMHKTAPGLSWKQIEYSNSMERQGLKINRGDFDFPDYARNDEESIADGYIKGIWVERGSNNQAGSVFDIEYDVETNLIYLVSAGGSLFKTDLNFQYWEVVNDDFRFSPGLLKILIKEDGAKRMIALINKKPHYSDDMGLSWQAAFPSYSPDNWAQVKDAFAFHKNGEDKIFILAKTGYWSDFYLYVSTDQGESYERLKRFYTSDPNNLAMTLVDKTGDIFIIEQKNGSQSRLFRYDFESNSLLSVRESSPISFGEKGKGNLAGVLLDSDSLKLYTYNEENELYNSLDTGLTWTYSSTLPTTPWEVRLYVSTQNPDLLLTGGVDCYRSLDAGESWSKINAWHEYYGNVEYKLHADIMHFDEFRDQSGNTFVTISNHGGLSISYDNTMTNKNIGLYDLNVSQYYSVRTSPQNPNLVFAGSQDQGLQRGIIHSNTTSNLEQVISGDYGHIVFTKNGNSLWTVYPGGWVSHYSNPAFGYLDASWELESDNETVWIPPLIPGPDPDQDIIYMAGGNIYGGGGSYIIKLGFENGTIVRDQLPFNFKTASNSEISAMAISPIDSSLWYVATNNGKFYYSKDGGQSFINALNSIPGSHYLYGSCVLPSSISKNTIYVSGSGYSTAGVIKSVDGGKTFGDISDGLPNTMVFAIAANENESLLFAATQAGPFVYITEKGKWFDLSGIAAPAQAYWSVEFLEGSQTARFGTYGRGIWDFEITEISVATEDINNFNNTLNLYPNPASDFVYVSISDFTDKEARIEVYNLEGKLLISKQLNNPEANIKIAIHKLNQGIYILRMLTPEGAYSSKLIKN